jgi:hypothetical protein
MFDYTKYSPVICFGIILIVLFVIWVFWGGKKYEFVGLAPLNPDTCANYSGSPYTWGTGDALITVNNNIIQPVETASATTEQTCAEEPSIVIDNTPATPVQFTGAVDVCANPTMVSNIAPAPKVNPIMPHVNSTCSIVKPGRFISRGERMCCQTMEKIYGVPFVSVRPSWLQNPETGMNLELDCYNDDLKIAVEYNGEQHYKWPNFTNQTYQQFINQVRRDDYKLEVCDRQGVYLITVPYNVAYENIPAYIMSQLPETLRKRLQDDPVHVGEA